MLYYYNIKDVEGMLDTGQEGMVLVPYFLFLFFFYFVCVALLFLFSYVVSEKKVFEIRHMHIHVLYLRSEKMMNYALVLIFIFSALRSSCRMVGLECVVWSTMAGRSCRSIVRSLLGCRTLRLHVYTSPRRVVCGKL